MSGADTAPAYCPYYCEENIWQLCADGRVAADDKRVLVISNAARQVACWGQRAAESAESVLVWDYHVVLAAGDAGRWQIWDLDTRLGLPVSAGDYLAQTFRPVPPRFAPLFRVIDCADYRRVLNTDRRHMRRQDGSYDQPPPAWPAIGQGFNLDRFIDMDDEIVGKVVDLRGVSVMLGVTPR